MNYRVYNKMWKPTIWICYTGLQKWIDVVIGNDIACGAFGALLQCFPNERISLDSSSDSRHAFTHCFPVSFLTLCDTLPAIKHLRDLQSVKKHILKASSRLARQLQHSITLTISTRRNVGVCLLRQTRKSITRLIINTLT